MVLRIPVLLLFFTRAVSRWFSFLFFLGYMTAFKQALRETRYNFARQSCRHHQFVIELNALQHRLLTELHYVAIGDAMDVPGQQVHNFIHRSVPLVCLCSNL